MLFQVTDHHHDQNGRAGILIASDDDILTTERPLFVFMYSRRIH
jgi:hypothetical protein